MKGTFNIKLIKTEDLGNNAKLEAIISETSTPIDQTSFDRGYARGLQNLKCEESDNDSYMCGYACGIINTNLKSLQIELPIDSLNYSKTDIEK